jgi:serine/threonine-protein kinase
VLRLRPALPAGDRPLRGLRCADRRGTGPLRPPGPFPLRAAHRLGRYGDLDLGLGRTVAVKTLPRVTPEQAQRLRREARAAASVAHPNLAAVYGLEPWHGTPLLVFEHIDAGTLADRLRAGQPLSPLAAIDLGVALASALERIHAIGVLHRDIKPSNIGFLADGTPKLLDFGVARLQHDLRVDAPGPGATPAFASGLDTTTSVGTSTGSRQMIGTPAYLSPEVVAGDPPGVRLDLWSVGVVLWESLSGRNLFAGLGFDDMIEQIRAARVPDLRAYLPGSPPALDALFRVLLAREPASRPATARELRVRLLALRRALGGGPPSRA